jgi:hypothetical protein
MDFTSKILNVNFIILIKSFFNLVNFSHIPKFKICGCDKTTLLNRNLVPRFLGTEKKKKQGTVRTE